MVEPLPSPETVLERIGGALKRYCEMLDIPPGMAATRAEVSSRYGWHCAGGQPVPADAQLRFANLLSIDPNTGLAAAPGMPPWRGPILWPFFAAGLRGRMLIDDLIIRETARLAGTSGTAVFRVTAARVVAAPSFLKLSRFLGRHPNEWTHPADAPSATSHVKQAQKLSDISEREPA